MLITKKQIQLIHIAKQQLCIDDDTYKELLANYHVDSSKHLTSSQAEHLLRHLRSKGFKIVKPARNKAKMHNKVIKLASPAQHRLINILKANIHWQISFESWLNKRMKIKNILTSKDASKVIEGLKGMLNIKTKHIEFLSLPFPQSYDLETLQNQWFFDILENRLVYVENGEICKILK